MKCGFRQDALCSIVLPYDLIVNFDDLFNGEIGHDILICAPDPCKASAFLFHSEKPDVTAVKFPETPSHSGRDPVIPGPESTFGALRAVFPLRMQGIFIRFLIFCELFAC